MMALAMNNAAPLPMDLDAKRIRLLDALREYGQVVVAFSGGIDSTVVAQAAFLALGDKARAVTADSPSVPRAEIETAKELAKTIGISHRVVQTQEFSSPDYVVTTAPAAITARMSCTARSRSCCLSLMASSVAGPTWMTWATTGLA